MRQTKLSLSLKKLPGISIEKKQKIVRKSLKFRQEFQKVEELQKNNYRTQQSWKKNQILLNKKLTSHEALNQDDHLQFSLRKSIINSIKGFPNIKSQKKIRNEQQVHNFKTISEHKNTIKVPPKYNSIQPQVKTTEIIETKLNIKDEKIVNDIAPKITPIFYFTSDVERNQQHQIQKQKTPEKDDKNKTRTAREYQKWVSNIYYDKLVSVQGHQKEQNASVIKKQQNFNIDLEYLQRLVQNFAKPKNLQQIQKSQLFTQIVQNYKMSVNFFNDNYQSKGSIQKIIKSNTHTSSISKKLKNRLDEILICSEGLNFIQMYNLSKIKYIPLLIQAYNIINKLKYFNHFYELSNIKLQINCNTTNTEIQKHIQQVFIKQKDQIQLTIFEIEQHLKRLSETINKDIEYMIKLNPRLVNTNGKKLVRLFIQSFQNHLKVIVRSVLAYSFMVQLQKYVLQLQQFVQDRPSLSLLSHCHPNNVFYQNIRQIKQPIKSKTQSPGLIIITLNINKLKRQKHSNIYKFLIESRQKIKEAKIYNNSSQTQNRIIYENPVDVIRENLIEKVQNYIKIISSSENVNGCINNSTIRLQQYQQYGSFKQKLQKLGKLINQKIINKYQKYFNLWELYWMQRPYIQNILTLYSKINGIQLVKSQMQCLINDLKIIKGFPDIISDGWIRINLSWVKKRLIDVIMSHQKKILKASEQTLQRLLDKGYVQVEKAKKLNQISPYSNILQYIDFLQIMNSRSVQKSIMNIANNSLSIRNNYNFLIDNKVDIKYSTLTKYLESGNWVRILRKSSDQNKKRIVVDPEIFMKGIQEKKNKINSKYLKILKSINQIFKVSELKSWQKWSSLSQSLCQEMQEINFIVNQLSKEEDLLMLPYFPQNGRIDHSIKSFKSNLTFFKKEDQSLKKYKRFWTYLRKFKQTTQKLHNTLVIDVDGENLLKLFRQGTQILSYIKSVTVNKRLLLLTEQLSSQLDNYIKSMRLIKLAMVGSENSKIKLMQQIRRQQSEYGNISNQILLKQSSNGPKQLYKTSLNDFLNNYKNNLQSCLKWNILLQMRRQEQVKQNWITIVNLIHQIIKNYDVQKVTLQGNRMRVYQFAIGGQQLIHTVLCFDHLVSEIQKSQLKLFHNNQGQENPVIETQKKLKIFYRTLLKLSETYIQLKQYYGWFCLVIVSFSIEEKFRQFRQVYEQIAGDFGRRSEMIKKLGWLTIYDDRIRINYSEEFKKLQIFKIKIANQIINLIQIPIRVTPEDAFIIIGSMWKEQLGQIMSMKVYSNYFCSLSIGLQYDQKTFTFILVLKQAVTIYNEYLPIENRKVQVKEGPFVLVDWLVKDLKEQIKFQTETLIYIIWQCHYNIKAIFDIYIGMNECLFESILNILRIQFGWQLQNIYENDYDLNLLKHTIDERYKSQILARQKENQIYITDLQNLYKQFLTQIDLLLMYNQVQRPIIYAFITKHRFFEEQTKDKQWISFLKDQLKDQFIMRTHLNSSLKKLNLVTTRPETKQIEKKQNIQSFLHLKKKKKIMNEIRLEYLGGNITPFLYQIPTTFDHFRREEIISTTLFLWSQKMGKIFITNVHPNWGILGRSFFFAKTYRKNTNLCISVQNHQNLLQVIRQITRQNIKNSELHQTHKSQKQKDKQRRKQNQKIVSGFYIFCNNNNITIQQQLVSQDCIWYWGHNNPLNNFLKVPLTRPQEELAKIFINNDIPIFSHDDSNCYSLITNNHLRDKKIDKGQIYSAIHKYYREFNIKTQIDNRIVFCLNYDTFGVSDLKFITEWLYEVRIRCGDAESKKKNVNVWSVPCYSFTKNELFGVFKQNIHESKIPDKLKRNVFHVKRQVKIEFVRGILAKCFNTLFTGHIDNDINEHLILGNNKNTTQNWLILDLTIDNHISKLVYSWISHSISIGNYIFQDSQIYSSTQLFQNKIIILLPKNWYTQATPSLPHFPIIKDNLIFDPSKYLMMETRRIMKKSPSLNFVKQESIYEKFMIESKKVKKDMLTENVMSLVVKIIEMMINELRKLKIANGYYEEEQLKQNNKSLLWVSAVELRQKGKKDLNSLEKIMEMEKSLQNTRKQLYKNPQTYHKNLTKSQTLLLQQQLLLLQPTYFSHDIVNQHLSNIIIFALYYSLVFYHPLHLVNHFGLHPTLSNLHNYTYHMPTQKWVRWQDLPSNHPFQAYSNDTNRDILDPLEIIKLNPSAYRIPALKSYSDSKNMITSQLYIKSSHLQLCKMFLVYEIPFMIISKSKNYPYWALEKHLLQFLNPTNNVSLCFPNIASKKNKIFYDLPSPKKHFIFIQDLNLENCIKIKPFLDYKKYEINKKYYPITHTSLAITSTTEQTHYIKQIVKINTIYGQDQSILSPYRIIQTMSSINNSRQMLFEQIVLLKFQENYKLLQQNKRRRKRNIPLSQSRLFGYMLDISQQAQIKHNNIKRDLLPIIENLNNKEINIQSAINQFNLLLNSLNSIVTIHQNYYQKTFSPRYLLNKPKKYINPLNPNSKPLFNEIVKIQQNTQVKLRQLCYIVSCFELNEVIIIVSVDGPYDRQIIQKYTLGFKAYVRANNQEKNNKSAENKLFSLNCDNLENQKIEVRQFSIKAVQQCNNIDATSHQGISLIKIETIAIKHQIINAIEQKIQGKKHFYILFVQHIQDKCQGYLTITQTTKQVITPSPIFQQFYQQKSKLNKQDDYQKYTKLEVALENYNRKIIQQQIENGFIGKIYKQSIDKKMSQLIKIQQERNEDLNRKKQLWKNLQIDIEILQNVIVECTKNIQKLHPKLEVLNNELGWCKNHRQFFNGEHQFEEARIELKSFQRKIVEKEILKLQYIQQNSINLPYIYVFNILADGSYFPDKSLSVLTQDYKLDSTYQIQESQKKLFIKLVTFGRLNAILDNQDLIHNGITQDQISIAGKVRSKFTYLKIQDNPSTIYSKTNRYQLHKILQPQQHILNTRCFNPIQRTFNTYITYLFNYKYTIWSLGSKQSQLLKSIRNLEDDTKYIEQKMRSSKNKLSQLLQQKNEAQNKLKISENEVQLALNNRSNFMKISQENINKIKEIYLSKLYNINIDLSEAIFNKSPLNPQQKRKLIYLVGLQQSMKIAKESKTMNQFFEKIINYLITKLGLQPSTNINKPSLLEMFLIQFQQDYINQPSHLVEKLIYQKETLDSQMDKFRQKIELVQTKSSLSIQKFELSSEAILSISEAINLATDRFQFNYQGDWNSSNQQIINQYSVIIQKIRHYYQKVINFQYYLVLCGKMCNKVGINNIIRIFKQIIYDHQPITQSFTQQTLQLNLLKSFQNINKSNKEEHQISNIIDEIDIQKELNQCIPINSLSLMVWILSVNQCLVFVRGDLQIWKILQNRCVINQIISCRIKLGQQIPIQLQNDTSRQVWVLIQLDLNQNWQNQLISGINQLKIRIKKHLKYILILNNDLYVDSLSKIQPIYYFKYSTTLLTSLMYSNLEHQFLFSQNQSCCSLILQIIKYMVKNSKVKRMWNITPIVQEISEFNKSDKIVSLIRLFLNQNPTIEHSMTKNIIKNLQKLHHFSYQNINNQTLYNMLDLNYKIRIQNPNNVIQTMYQSNKISVNFIAKMLNENTSVNTIKLFEVLSKNNKQQVDFDYLSDPHIYMILTRVFKRVFKKIISKRSSLLIGFTTNKKNVKKNEHSIELFKQRQNTILQMRLKIWNKSNQVGHSMGHYVYRLIDNDNNLQQNNKIKIKTQIGGYCSTKILGLLNRQVSLVVEQIKINQKLYEDGLKLVYEEVKGDQDLKMITVPLYSINYQWVGIFQFTMNFNEEEIYENFYILVI